MLTRIAGIPCQIHVTTFQRGCASRTNADPNDCWESEPDEIEFDVLDRRGRPAPWLARKLTDQDIARIEQQIMEATFDD